MAPFRDSNGKTSCSFRSETKRSTSSWVTEFPEQAALLRHLMSPSPSDRPSAPELLQNALPPRMEDEWLDDILRAMQSLEDTRVYEKVVQKIFDKEVNDESPSSAWCKSEVGQK